MNNRFLSFIFTICTLITLSSQTPSNNLGNDIYYLGFNDYHASYLEGSNYLRNGLTFNSFMIKDEKTIIIESMYKFHEEEWLEEIEKNLPKNGAPDYFLIQHFEADNIGSIISLIKKYPLIKLLATKKCFNLMDKYIFNYHKDVQPIQIVIEDGDELPLGKHTLQFLETPFHHWPEIILCFDKKSKILFSNKIFGIFGSNAVYETWDSEPRRYYFNILSQNSKQISMLIQKMQKLQVEQIYPVHGRLLTENMPHPYYLYGLWTSFKPEEQGVVIAYNSFTSNTEIVVNKIAEKLKYLGEKVILYDLDKIHWNFVISDVFKFSKLILASATKNEDIMPSMRSFIEHLIEDKFQKRVVGFVENGSWNPKANKIMREMMSKCEKITYINQDVTIWGKMKDLDWIQIDEMARQIRGANPEG